MRTTTQPTPTTRVRPADRAAASRVLAAAFVDDPVFAWCIPDRGARVEQLPEFFAAFVDVFAWHNETYRIGNDDETVGAALWAPPGVHAVHPDDEEQLGERIAAACGEAIERIGTCTELFDAAHPEQPAWFLQFVGVDPAQQGRGYGSQLMRRVLDAADAAGEGAHLIATSTRNRATYEHHGFRVTADVPLPGGPTAYAMWRDPAPRA